MKAASFLNFGPIAVLVVAFAFVGTARADSLTETNTTVDGTSVVVDVGRGETFTCLDDADQFSCSAGAFTCYGWGNCSSLDATGGTLTLVDFINNYGDGPVEVVDSGAPVATPEPELALLLTTGLVGLGLTRKKSSSLQC